MLSLYYFKYMKAKAIYLGQHLNLKGFQTKFKLDTLEKDPVLYEMGEGKYAVLFKYGVAVFWDFEEGEINDFLMKLVPFVENALSESPSEEMEIKTKKFKKIIDDGVIYLEEITNQVIQLLSVILARSVILDYQEQKVDSIMLSFGKVIDSFSKNGKPSMAARTMLKMVGGAMKIKNDTVSQMALLDKPDFTWNDSNLDEIFTELDEEYEISDRYSIVTQKINALFQDSEFIMNYLESKKSTFLELIIIVLIFIEIVLFIYDLVV